jgi:hypothetical protein
MEARDMKITLTLSKAEFDVIRRGVSDVLADEAHKGYRRMRGGKISRAFRVADGLDTRLNRIAEQLQVAEQSRKEG